VTVGAHRGGEPNIRRSGAHFREGSLPQSLFEQLLQLHKTTDAPGHTSHIQPKDEKNVIRINHVRMPMFPEPIFVPDSGSDPFRHKDGTDGRVSIPKSEKCHTRYDQEATHPPPRPLATACMSGGSLSPKLSQACVVPIPKSPINP
jgi:hypothetical protein